MTLCHYIRLLYLCTFLLERTICVKQVSWRNTQDVVLIKNLLVSVQSRWEKVVQRSIERGRSLDDARKRAKQVSCKRIIPIYWTTLDFTCWVEIKVLCCVYVHSCYNLFLHYFQFHEAWKKLIDWLEDAESHLDSELEISNDPDKIKLQLSKHKVHWLTALHSWAWDSLTFVTC